MHYSIIFPIISCRSLNYFLFFVSIKQLQRKNDVNVDWCSGAMNFIVVGDIIFKYSEWL